MLLIALCFSVSLSHAQLPSGFIRTRVATGLNPTSMVIASDGRIFITEKNGSIRVIRDDQLLPAHLLTLEVDDSNERGLGHMVLHPNFQQNGYYYVFYSVPGLGHNRISRFTSNGNTTIPGSELEIMNLDPLGSEVHNGGDMVFGFDGYLYVGTGDGGQSSNGENLAMTNGKILRMDDLGNPVTDNPWYELNDGRSRWVYAYGFRNPFTLTLHPVTGEIYANDVGGGLYEEINHVVKGAFYGWPRLEGKRTNQIVPEEYKDPLYQYNHSNGYCGIVGSVFYAPAVQQFPNTYKDRYFYSDYCTGHIRMLDVATAKDKGKFISDGNRVIDLDISAEGSLYYLERQGIGDGSPEDNTGTNEGTLWKVSYTGSGAPFISVQPESVLVAIGEDARFSVLASGAFPLRYRWFINDEELETGFIPFYTITNVNLQQDSSILRVEVINDFATVASQEAILRVTNNHRPIPVITVPAAGSMYTGGQVILFSGVAVDDEDGTLLSDALSWRIDFHHGTHTHPALSWTTGISNGEWRVPELGETSSDVWYRIYLRATDADGLAQTIYHDIYPEIGKVYLTSIPEGLILRLDGAPMVTPFEVEGVHGISRFITPPDKQIRGDSLYFFSQWSDGGSQYNREIKTSEKDQYFQAQFQAIRNGTGIGLTASFYDNIEFTGEPVVTVIDSIINHQFHLNAPYPGLPADYFGIRWKGYIQPYTTGMYYLKAVADDGFFVEIDGRGVLQNWNPGLHYESDSIYLEGGRLYPIHIRLYDVLYNSQMKLRWSSSQFPEEIIPSSQLYPDDFVADPHISDILSMQTTVAGQLMIRTESFKDLKMDFKVFNMTGLTLDFPGQWIHIGKNIFMLDISFLPPGVYYVQGIEKSSGISLFSPFVKIN